MKLSNMKRWFFLLVFAMGVAVAQAQDPIFKTDGVAIRGYDPVAYFNDSAPVMGSKEFTYTWQGAVWQFKNEANRMAFKANPEKYAPQFGGFCAYGASENHKSPTEPDAFTIVNDKLYLNYNIKVKQLWLKDRDVRIEKAVANWATLKDSKE